ncbi:MAG TPA: phospholipid carrier-dependent glycosyltransferase [Candidatus Binataceae bacterium]|nr:phospholipid carrier-dependent glycosyltransferase [Candidatus Binataceae bacterium]
MENLPAPPRRGLTLALATVVVAAALVLNNLGTAEVCGSNEAVEAIFVQQMVEHGRLLFPLENGHAPMYKPPLFHWTATALDHLMGESEVNSFNLRFASALYAVAGVILTIAFSWQFIGASSGWLAGFILCGSYQYIEQGRIGRVDMTLCFFETLALMAFMWWYADEDSTRRDWLPYVFAGALGLGVLAKGPVGVILPAATCVIFLVVQRQTKQLSELASPGAIALAVIIGGSWYAACFFGRRYAFLDRQLGSENFGRFFGSLGAMPVWYYVEPILLNSGPLSLLVPLAVFFALRTYWRKPAAAEGDPLINAVAPNARALDAVRLFAIFWLISIIFFSAAAYKRRAYLLPLWPTAAVMLTWWLQSIRANSPVWGHRFRRVVVLLCCGLILFNSLFLPAHQVQECAGDSVQDAAQKIDRIVGKDEPLYLYGFAEDPAPLLFYLDRSAPPISGKLGDAPPGYVIVPAEIWRKDQQEALDLTPVFESSSGRPPVVLLRHGRALAMMR